MLGTITALVEYLYPWQSDSLVCVLFKIESNIPYKILRFANSIVTGHLQVHCNFDAGEMLLYSVLRVFNPEGYRMLVWTHVKGS